MIIATVRSTPSPQLGRWQCSHANHASSVWVWQPPQARQCGRRPGWLSFGTHRLWPAQASWYRASLQRKCRCPWRRRCVAMQPILPWKREVASACTPPHPGCSGLSFVELTASKSRCLTSNTHCTCGCLRLCTCPERAFGGWDTPWRPWLYRSLTGTRYSRQHGCEMRDRHYYTCTVIESSNCCRTRRHRLSMAHCLHGLAR